MLVRPFSNRRGLSKRSGAATCIIAVVFLATLSIAASGCGGDDDGETRKAALGSTNPAKPPQVDPPHGKPVAGKPPETGSPAGPPPPLKEETDTVKPVDGQDTHGDPPGGNKPPTEPPPSGDPLRCTIKGSARSEKLKGTAKADVICARGGSDTVRGGGGNDYLRGGSGNDKLYGEGGTDTLDGEGGKDSLFGGKGLDTGIAGRGDNLKQIENRKKKTDQKARAAAAGDYRTLGNVVCGLAENSFYEYPPVGGPGWVKHYNGIARRQPNGTWRTIDWHGPHWQHTNWPGWYWYGGTWSHANDAGGASSWDLGQDGDPGYYAGIQFIYWNGSNTNNGGGEWVNTVQYISASSFVPTLYQNDYCYRSPDSDFEF